MTHFLIPLCRWEYKYTVFTPGNCRWHYSRVSIGLLMTLSHDVTVEQGWQSCNVTQTVDETKEMRGWKLSGGNRLPHHALNKFRTRIFLSRILNITAHAILTGKWSGLQGIESRCFRKWTHASSLRNISVSYLFACSLCLFVCVSPPIYENTHNIIKHIRSSKTKMDALPLSTVNFPKTYFI